MAGSLSGHPPYEWDPHDIIAEVKERAQNMNKDLFIRCSRWRRFDCRRLISLPRVYRKKCRKWAEVGRQHIAVINGGMVQDISRWTRWGSKLWLGGRAFPTLLMVVAVWRWGWLRSAGTLDPLLIGDVGYLVIEVSDTMTNHGLLASAVAYCSRGWRLAE